MALAREAAFSKIHVFPFSPRRGTAAWQWRRETPPAEVVKARCRRLAELERESAEAFRRAFIGQTVEVLVEQPNARTPPGLARGLTDRYVEVVFDVAEHPCRGPAAEQLVGQVVPVRVTGLSQTGLSGTFAGEVPHGAGPV